MLTVVYLIDGEKIVCRMVSKCDATGLVKIENPQGITDSILPHTTAKYLIVRPDIIKYIYVGIHHARTD